MDAFEQLASELLFAGGWWVETSVKVALTKEEKRKINRPSTPRWELDLVAYKGATNEVMVLECKSFLDSRGVTWRELQDGDKSTRYKMFREPVLRDTVLARLATQMVGSGRCRPHPVVRLGMIAGKISGSDGERLAEHFAARGWLFFGPDWIRDQLSKIALASYSNQVSAVVAKLLLREGGKSVVLAPANGTRLLWDQQAPLEVLVSANPKRPGSASHARFEYYYSSQAKTLGEALAAGVLRADIRNDVEKGYIRVG